jgi:hypothetical protein
MSQIVKLRRSSVSGQKPTNSNLQLGELALNTTDGKVYMAKSGSLGPSVEELITTNTVNTGSLSITGAITGSIFTGSFKGDGSQLYNLPYSGLTNVPTLVSGSSQIFTGYDYEIHVSQVDGNDTTGNGGLLTPVASITKALTLVTGQRRTVIIHPGSYTESPSITTQYTVLTTFEPIGGNTAIIGTVSTSVGCTITGLAITNLTITAGTGVGVPNIINCNITGTLTKSGNATFTDIHNCDIGTACNITGTGLVTINDGNPNFVTVNNAGANVIIKNTMSCVAPSVIAGTLNITDSVVIAAVTNAVTSNASSVVTLANSQFLTSALNNVAPVSLSGFYSIFNCVFDKPNSTLVSLSGTGGSTNSVDYFQYIDADNITTKGLTVTGSLIVTNGITGSIDYSNITNKPTLVSGSSQISYTGITDIPLGIVSGSSQIIDLGFTTTSSFNSFASGALMSYQTSSMTVLSSSYAVTASYALNGGGGGTEGRTSKLEQTVVSDTWTFAHNLGEKYPAIEVFDENDYVIIPTNILAVDENNLTITFSHEITGVATATVGGGLPYISGSYNGRVLAVSAGNPTWKEGMISGSLQVSNFGFATTGSNSFKDNQIITGSVTVRNAKMDATCVTLTSNATIFNLGSYDGAIFDYVVKNGGNMRAGTITGVWNGAAASYNETSTVDMGTTSNISFNVTGTGLLNAVIAGGTWQVEVFYRALGCSS